MDFRQFHYFVTAAEELHFARASERLGIAPAALSLQIKALEIRLGVRLFYRTKRRVELTEAGITFLHRARTTLEMAQREQPVAAPGTCGWRNPTARKNGPFGGFFNCCTAQVPMSWS